MIPRGIFCILPARDVIYPITRTIQKVQANMCATRTGSCTTARRPSPRHAKRATPRRRTRASNHRIHFPPPTSTSITAQHSKTKHTPSKQARQAKPVGHISPKATGPARLSWESRKKQRPNPIHPEGSRKKKEKKKDSQFHASSSKSVALLTDPLACQDSLLSLPSPIHPMRLSKPRLPPPPPPSRPPSFQVDAMR